MGRDGRGVKAGSKTSIQVSFSYRGVECRERLKLEPTDANIAKAINFRAAILHSIEIGTFDYSVTFPDSKNRYLFSDGGCGRKTMAAFMGEWLRSKEGAIKSSTYVEYEKMVRNQIIPALGDVYVQDLKRSQVKSWLIDLSCSNKRLLNLQSVLRSALNDAVIDEIIDHNILHG